jgi:hypothetical protein
MKTQGIAMGWLVAGVLAAGLNAMYHDGGFEWAHRLADQAQRESAAVLAYASDRADQFLSEAQFRTARHETSSCRFATAFARLQTNAVRFENLPDLETLTAREEAQLSRMEAQRACIEARLAQVQAMSASFNRVRVPVVCPRVRVNVPVVRIPEIHAPEIHISSSGTGPV